ncbi:stage II sporulation protein R [Halonatronum saccharophilum]|uniref:stage II sporulation protein R n=1 Tax=Halonatronum saccharophilum TaxID=150060 RepID=UPI000481E30D|nr:stage II sporulation protein R [Halonatronum saccharophilum]
MRRSSFIVVIVLVVIILSLFANKKAFVLDNNSIDYNPDNLLRLHIIPNSNSFPDQSLKREVRNEIIKKVKPIFEEAKTIEEASKSAEKEIDYIKGIILEKIINLGYEYKVEIEVGKYHFPTRSYGDTTLPEGDYNALRVTIGEGSGSNWWCVLFPPLCFIDSVEESSKDLSEGIEIEGELEVDYRFKLVEYIENNPEFVKRGLKLAKIFPWLD